MTTPIRILVADDDAAKRLAIARILHQADHEVLQAAGGVEALDLAKTAAPDLVLLDVEMPDLSGTEVCLRLRADPATSALPVLYLSAHRVTSQHRIEGLDSGADGYLVWPVDPRELLAWVRTLLRVHHTERALCAANADWHHTLESISDAFFALDDAWRVVHFNAAAERALGRGREQVLGRHLLDSFPEARGSVFEAKYAEALRDRQPLVFETFFARPPYANWYEVRIYPREPGISVYFQVITARKQAEAERENLIRELQSALANVKTLHKLLPICASCKKIRDDDGYWQSVEGYMLEHADVRFSHGLCPDCLRACYAELNEDPIPPRAVPDENH
ncbi:MAG: response regulator [Candidatus Competibacteraceae bacterium]